MNIQEEKWTFKRKSGYWNGEEELSEENLMAFFVTEGEKWNRN